MALTYHIIEIFTSEEARYKGRPLYQAVIEHVRSLKIAARCIVTKGVAGCYENGEIATHGIEILSFNMPLKIEIILPAPELEVVLPALEEIVTDGIVVVENRETHIHRAKSCLLPRQLKVRDVMTSQPHSIPLEISANEIAHLLLSHDFNGVPVVDPENRPVGMVTQRDLIERAQMPVRLGLLEEMDSAQVQSFMESMSRFKASEIMSRPAIVVNADDQLIKAVDLMLGKGLKRLPVVNTEGKLAGILSRLDIFHSIIREVPDWKGIKTCNVQVRDARFVSDIMVRDTFTVLPDASIEEVIRVIVTKAIQRVAVVDEQGHLLGLISDRVLLAAFSEHRASLWELFIRKFSFAEIGKKHKALLERLCSKTVKEVMQVNLVTVNEDTPIDEAIRVMIEKGIKRLPVLDHEGKFKGMVSRDALLRTGLAKA